MNKWRRVRYQPNIPLGDNGEKVTGSKEHIQLSKNAAKEGMVLLKNLNNLLPVKKGTKLALFGKGTIDYVKGGGGSGDVTVEYTTNLYEGFENLNQYVSVYPELIKFYKKEVEGQYEAGIAAGMTEEPELTDEMCKSARVYTDTAVISICRFSGEGWDRKSEYDMAVNKEIQDQMLSRSDMLFEYGDFYLGKKEKSMVDMVKKYFPNIIVVMNVGGMVDTEWFANDNKIQSVLMAWQGGIEGGMAAAELICGIGTPSGKLSDTFAKKLEDYPSSYNFHESEEYVDYTEDVYVGYRYFETISSAKERVNYPFGFGLSYTSFEREVLGVKEEKGIINIRVRVTNTGKCSGKEVIQVYVNPPQGVLGKPERNLVAFEKTRLLEAGETQILFFQINSEDFASYDDLGKLKKSAYILEKGEYKLYVGNSVRDTELLDYTYIIYENKIIKQLSSRLVPTSLSKRMTADGGFESLPITEANDPNQSDIERVPREISDGYSPKTRELPGVHLWSHPYKKGVRIFDEVAEGRMTLKEFIHQMDDKELAHLLGGQPNTGVANTFGFGNMPEYGIPNIMTADGPAGLRIEPKCGVNTTAWPCSTLLACTWNRELAYEIGEAGAKEVKENNIAVWLTPAVNIHRSPLCGRNFEYYSEDPFLTGKMAAAMVRGIQSQHISAAVKHFALNNKETNRMNSDSRVSERAAREIYLKAFQIIVQEAEPWCIMTSYNIINGHRSSENRDLIQGILRDEWNYKGMITTDWWNMGEHYKEVKAGNDIKMACGFPDSLLKAKEKGVLTREEMEICGTRILELILKID